MSFPRRPSQNEDPWYSAREAYDQAIEDGVRDSHRSRGTLPSMDLDDARGPDYLGVWVLHVNNTYQNLPNEFPQENVVLEVVRTGLANALIQRITAGGLPERWFPGVYWRESTSSGFRQWMKVASNSAVDAPASNNGVARAWLDEGTDLDTLSTRDTAGVYGLRGGAPYTGLPQTFMDNPFNTSQTLNVWVTGRAGTAYQELIIAGDPSGGGNDRIGVWHRSMNNTGTYFFDWVKLVTVPQIEEMISGGSIVSSNEVQTINVTSNPNQASRPNELLIVIE